MFNRQFMDRVRQQLIKVLSQQARAARTQAVQGTARDQAPSEFHPLRYRADDVVAFVDLQNLHYFLKDNCRVAATQVHVPNLLKEYAASHHMPLREIHIFTGIHDPEREPQRYESMAKRLKWLERMGCFVTALPLSYYRDRETQVWRAQEKGIDVRIGSEILRAVNDGLHRAIVITQDKDIAEAIFVAAEMAQERGRTFMGYTPVLDGTSWEHSGKCGMNGLRGTSRLPITVDMVTRHVRPERTPGERTSRLDTRQDMPAEA